MQTPTISHGSGATLFDTEGKEYTDLSSANGVAWLGHADPKIGAAVQEQLTQVWATGRLPTEVARGAASELEGFLPEGYRFAGFYSTGAEVLEFAARVARRSTARSGLVGFRGSMHGKTMLASYLGWDNGDGLAIPDSARLPYPPEVSEEECLSAVRAELSRGAAAAVCFEPMQGCRGGFSPSEGFVKRLREITSAHGVLLLFDELLTGLHRTGPRFAFEAAGVSPDMVLIGKSLGNGFPVSALAVREPLEVRAEMLPGSTFAGNPLAAAAVRATLLRMREYNLATMAREIGEVIESSLSSTVGRGAVLRGKGAFWVLTMPKGFGMEGFVQRVYARGVAIGYTGLQVRLLPPVVIGRDALQRACDILREEFESQCGGSRLAAGAN